MKKRIFGLVGFLILVALASQAQLAMNVPTSASSQFGAWRDPALNHNALLKEKTGEGSFIIIGGFKVKGSPYLFGPSHKGNMFSTEAMAYNIKLSYNTYNQELEFITTSNPDKPLVKEPGTVDSFLIQKDIANNILGDLKFIYGSILGTKDKAYYQEIFAGPKFTLYKKYKSELNYVSENYIQSELREFEMQVEYYYKTADEKGLKKIKPNAYAVAKEFKNVTDLSKVVTADDFSVNQEAAFIKAFSILNQ